jgi:hypothetical protein
LSEVRRRRVNRSYKEEAGLFCGQIFICHSNTPEGDGGVATPTLGVREGESNRAPATRSAVAPPQAGEDGGLSRDSLSNCVSAPLRARDVVGPAIRLAVCRVDGKSIFNSRRFIAPKLNRPESVFAEFRERGQLTR